MSAPPYKPEYPPDSPSVIVIQPVEAPFAEAVDYLNYRLITDLTLYDNYGDSELNKMTEKTTVQR